MFATVGGELMCRQGFADHIPIQDGSSESTRDAAWSCDEYAHSCVGFLMIGQIWTFLNGPRSSTEFSGLEPSGAIPLGDIAATYHRPISPGPWMKSCHGWADHMIEHWQGVT
jgi:hypothetical protein